GSGKSSLAFAVMRALDANGRVTGGSIRFQGDDLLALAPAALQRVRGARIAMVFQDPHTALNPTVTVGEQVAEVLRAHAGLSRARRPSRSPEGRRYARGERGRAAGLAPPSRDRVDRGAMAASPPALPAQQAGALRCSRGRGGAPHPMDAAAGIPCGDG